MRLCAVSPEIFALSAATKAINVDPLGTVRPNKKNTTKVKALWWYGEG